MKIYKCGSKPTMTLTLDTAAPTGMSLYVALYDEHRRTVLLLSEGNGITKNSTTSYGIVLTVAQTAALKPGRYLLEFAFYASDHLDGKISVNEVPVEFRASVVAGEVLS